MVLPSHVNSKFIPELYKCHAFTFALLFDSAIGEPGHRLSLRSGTTGGNDRLCTTGCSTGFGTWHVTASGFAQPIWNSKHQMHMSTVSHPGNRLLGKLLITRLDNAPCTQLYAAGLVGRKRAHDRITNR